VQRQLGDGVAAAGQHEQRRPVGQLQAAHTVEHGIGVLGDELAPVFAPGVRGSVTASRQRGAPSVVRR
jgi:hypothetical protein